MASLIDGGQQLDVLLTQIRGEEWERQQVIETGHGTMKKEDEAARMGEQRDASTSRTAATNEATPACSGPHTDAFDCPVHNPRLRDSHIAHERLIAAAPDLLDIARTIVAVCDSGNVEHAQLACMETSPLVDAARAAIAKAEGR